MKKIILPILLVVSTQVFSQSFRLHIGGGFANYLGDLQQKKLSFDQIKGVYSFGAAYDITEKIVLRIDYSQGSIGGDDKKGNSKLQKRNLNFQSSITDVTLLAEYNWLNNYTGKFVPYVFTGIGAFKFNPYTFDNAGRKVFLHDLSTEGQGLSKYPTKKPYQLRQMNIPFGGGFKYNVTSTIFIAGEIGIRKIFTDYLDDVSSSFVDGADLLRERGQTAVDLAFRADELPPYNAAYPKGGAQRGNADGKDWYYFGQFRISFKLGWGDGGGRGFRSGRKGFLRSLGCPGRF